MEKGQKENNLHKSTHFLDIGDEVCLKHFLTRRWSRPLIMRFSVKIIPSCIYVLLQLLLMFPVFVRGLCGVEFGVPLLLHSFVILLFLGRIRVLQITLRFSSFLSVHFCILILCVHLCTIFLLCLYFSSSVSPHYRPLANVRERYFYIAYG